MRTILPPERFSAFLKAAGVILCLAISASAASAQPVPQALAQRAQRAGEVRVIVRLREVQSPAGRIASDVDRAQQRADIGWGQDSVRARLRGVPHRIVREFRDFPFMALQIGPVGLRALESLPGVVAEVMEDQLRRPFLAQSAPLVQADQAANGAFENTFLDGTGTVVAILDTGVDKNHLFLSGKVVDEACYSSTFVPDHATSLCPGGAQTSIVPGSGMPCNFSEDCDHGTHVAGIAAGDGQNGVVASFSGVAKGADVMAVKVFTRFDDPAYCSPEPSCAAAYDSDILAGLQHVYDQRGVFNIAAVNLSLGGGSFSRRCDRDPDGQLFKSIIDLLRAENIATVIASGNEYEPRRLSFPACVSSAVSVGSTGDGSTFQLVPAPTDIVSSFSNVASFLSLLAPGQWITSSIPGDGFDTWAGTSMSTPHVTGAFAILKEAVPTATVSQMLGALKKTGLPVRDTRPGGGITKPRIRIVDALGQLPSVQFSSATYTVSEGNRSARITVKRTGVPIDILTVDYASSDGTAAAGSDYGAVSGTLTFPPHATSKSFTIPIINDIVDELDETINLTLSNPIGGRLGAINTATVTITDND